MESFISQAVVTGPLEGKSLIRIGWIVPRGGKRSSLTEQFVRLLEESVQESIRFTARMHQSLTEGHNN